ncbi:hypothetical protein ACHAWF_013153 [Thalassiosira exigua]
MGGGVVFRRQSARVVTATGRNGGEPPNDSMRDTTVERQGTIAIPQSTHCLLFTENILSLPFAFAFAILLLSMGCLGLALWDGMSLGTPGNPLGVPANVRVQVRVAEFFSIIVALLMEEEIPCGTYLLRMVPRSSAMLIVYSSVENKLGVSYAKFVISAMLRLVIGYLFLLNVFLAVVQSASVLEMFYDMLALNFVAMTDDIAFKLAKYDILGKTLRNAANAPYFGVEFAKKPYFFRKKMTIAVKILYLFNFLLFVAGFLTIAVMQRKGRFQCDSISVTFGEHVWEDAQANFDGLIEKTVLVYSFFNGVYVQTGRSAGRPIYTEIRKTEDSQFETKVGAEINIVRVKQPPQKEPSPNVQVLLLTILFFTPIGAWVFVHKQIVMSQDVEDSECPWLLRSPDTDAYDLLEVTGEWSVWVGVIKKDAEVKVTCNYCRSDIDCNLNGKCIEGKCNCTSAAGHYGLHCELREPCQKIIGEKHDSAKHDHAWSLVYTSDCHPLLEYGRPVYSLVNHLDDAWSLPHNITGIHEDDLIDLIYSGSRWLVVNIKGGKNYTPGALEYKSLEYHAFWDKAFNDHSYMVSDPTTKSFPVGVDFYQIGERGQQYGPFGVLHPIQDPPGRGHFRCDDNIIVTENENASKFDFWTSCSSSLEERAQWRNISHDHSHM